MAASCAAGQKARGVRRWSEEAALRPKPQGRLHARRTAQPRHQARQAAPAQGHAASSQVRVALAVFACTYSNTTRLRGTARLVVYSVQDSQISFSTDCSATQENCATNVICTHQMRCTTYQHHDMDVQNFCVPLHRRRLSRVPAGYKLHILHFIDTSITMASSPRRQCFQNWTA